MPDATPTPPSRADSYRTLSAGRIVETADALALRIGDRFPDSGLSRCGEELVNLSRHATQRCALIAEPNLPLRIAAALLVLFGVAGTLALVTQVKLTEGMWHIDNFLDEVNSALGSLVFLGAAIAFVVTFETRIKRRKALHAIAELRALAHIIDMHQLTKDPEPILDGACRTKHSPVRNMTAFELSRYFDYCSEMLSLTSKIGALYVQAFPDSAALAAVDEVETLCTGLSRKIWQKMMILDRFEGSRGDALDAQPASD